MPEPETLLPAPDSFTVDTREHPGPFDGLTGAKPDEPIFTLQGGDPTAAALVMLWAHLARYRAGVISSVPLQEQVQVEKIPQATVEAEQQELLLRATSAEQVAWAMQAYIKGHPSTSDQDAAFVQAQEHGSMVSSGNEDAMSKLLKHRRLRHCFERLGNAAAELMEVAGILQGYEMLAEFGIAHALSEATTELSRDILPSRTPR